MSVNGKYPEQLIAMVTPEMKADIRAEADERGVSISQVVREAREAALDIKAKAQAALDRAGLTDADVERINAGVRVIERSAGIVHPETEAFRAAEEANPITLSARGAFVPAGNAGDQDPDTFAAYAADLSPDTEPDEVDGSLSDQSARVARLKARGLL